MQEQINTIREAMEQAHIIGGQDGIDKALTALVQIEAMAGEPVAWMYQHDETGRMTTVANDGINPPEVFTKHNPRWRLIGPCFAAPVAQQPQQCHKKANDYCKCPRKAMLCDGVGPAQQPQAEAVLRKLEWTEVRYEYRGSEYFCPICDRDKKQGHEAGCEMAAALAAQGANHGD